MKYILSKHRAFTAALFAALCSALLALGLCFFAPQSARAEEGGDAVDLSAAVVTVTGGDFGDEATRGKDKFYYTGSPITPVVTVTLDGKEISNITEVYRVEITNGTEVGTATVTVTGILPYYKGSATGTFEIMPVELTKAVITLKGGTAATATEFFYTGDEIIPTVLVEINGKALDSSKYDVVFSDNVAKGTATATVTGKNGYTGAMVAKFTIVDKATNAWIVPPSLSGWRWKAFDPETNKISAEARYGTDTAVFRIFGSNKTPVTYGEGFEGVNGDKTAFMLDNGEMPDEVKTRLASLEIGKYYIFANIAKGDKYTKLGEDVLPADDDFFSHGYMFEVSKSENSWLRMPSIVAWTWGDFKKSVNIIAAVPKYADVTTKICYGIYISPDYSGAEYVNGLKEFYTVNGVSGEVDNATAIKLSELPAGTYYLRATTNDSQAEYGALDTFVQFTVQKMQNHWVSTPNVAEWTWSEYNPEINTITADPTYPKAGTNITFGIYVDEYCSRRAEGITDFNEVDEDVSRALSAMPAGNYWLKAATNDNSKNYTDLETIVPFTVHKIRNYWTSTPNVVQWNYNSFNINVNTFSAVPAFRNIDSVVTFGLFTDRDGEHKVAGLDSFTEVTADMAEILNKLPAGQYWLRAVTDDRSENYYDLTTSVPFSIMPANNVWEASPYVISWKYGEYSKDFNKVYALPKYGTAEFSIFTEQTCAADSAIAFDETYQGNNKKFVLDENGLVPDYVANKLSSLGKGSYYLLAVCAGANNYTELNLENSVPVPFEIQAVQNGWADVPSLVGWSEGNFDEKVNIFVGSARHGDTRFGIYDSGDNLLFIVWTKGGEAFSVTRSNGEKVTMNELNTLAVGSYKLTAEVEGTDNYSALSAETTFAVFEDSVGLNGIIAAVVTFAVLDVVAAAVCITLIIIRRKKVEAQFRNMVRKELGRR